MNRLTIFRISVTLCCLALTVVSVNGEDGNKAQISELVEKLSSVRYSERESATLKLIEAGAPAISQVAAAAKSKDFEVAWRSRTILEQLAVSHDEETMIQVAAVFADLANAGDKEAKKIATELMARFNEKKSQIAIQKIRALGGVVTENNNQFAFDGMGFGGGGVVFGAVVPAKEIRPRIVVDKEFVELEALIKEIEIKKAIPKDKVKLAPKTLVVPKLEKTETKPKGRIKEEAKKELPAPKQVDEKEGDQQARLQFENHVQFVSLVIGSQEKATEKKPVQEVAIQVEAVQKKAAEKKAVQKKAAEKEAAIKAEELKIRKILEKAMADKKGAVIKGPAPIPVFGGGFVPGPGVTPDNPFGSRHIEINENWKGGQDGLKYLSEIHNLSSLRISSFDLTPEGMKHLGAVKSLQSIYFYYSGFDAKSMMAFIKAHPNVSVSCVGKAMLGVYAADPEGAEQDGCSVDRVEPNSGAAEAGLIAGDKITSVNGVAIKNFPELTYNIAGREVGESMKVTVMRGDEKVNMTITLKGRDELQQ